MNKLTEWVKHHPAAAAAGVIAALVVLYLISRNSSSSSSGIAGAVAANQQNQLQAAQLNAQYSAQSEQTQAQLASEEYSGGLAEQEQQNQLAGSIIGAVIPAQLQASLYSEALGNQAAYQKELTPFLSQAFAVTGESNRGVIGEDELALLLGAGENNPGLVASAGGLNQNAGPPSQNNTGLSLAIPGVGNLGLSGI